MSTQELTTPLFATPAAELLPVKHLFDMAVDLEMPLVYETPVGTRLTYIIKGGSVLGPRVRGELLAGGGDWVVLGSDGVSRLDVRGTIRTDDGALIHYSSLGVVQLPDDGRDRIGRGERIAFNEGYIRTTPRFETSDERYLWLNGMVFIGVNELAAGHIDYRVYSVQ